MVKIKCIVKWKWLKVGFTIEGVFEVVKGRPLLVSRALQFPSPSFLPEKLFSARASESPRQLLLV